MICFQALCQIICLFMYFYYFQKSRNVMFSGTVSDYLFIYVFLLFLEVQKCYVFRHCVRLFVYLCISIISRSPEMLCFQALCQIICLFMYFYYFQKSRNVMFSGTVSDYLFIYVFLLFPEVQKCYVFRHCARLCVYLCISIISRSPEMLCFQALCQIICLFMYFYYFQKSRNVMFSGTVPDYVFIYVFLLFPEVQKCYVFRLCARLFVYLCISIISRSPEMICFQALCQIICLFMYFYYFQKSRNVMFSGSVPDYLFIYVFLLFPEVQKCYVFRHCVRLFVYLCISIISRSPEMLCFQALCQIICLFMYFYYFQKSRNDMFSGTVSDYLFIYVFLLFPEVQKCYVFRHCVRLFVYLCISIISRSPEMLCFQALCQIICLFMYFYYFQKSRNVMFSGTVSDYLFIYVFLLFPEVQKCYVFRHCVRLFVYLCISIISRSPEMLCFQALCQIICLFMYFYYFQKSRNVMFSGTVPDYLFIYVFLLFPEVQKCYVFRHCARLFVYLCISIISRSPEMLCFQALCQIICLFMYFYYFQKSRNVMFSGTVSDYLFIYVFLLFPEVQKCYVFRHCARLFVYLCISIISRSPEMLCFQALCQIICLFMYFYYFQKSRNVMFSGTVPDYLFIYVFLLFPEVQKCHVFRLCARLFVYLCISIISEVQKCYVFRHCVRLFVYLCISIISRSPEMYVFRHCQIICLFMYFYYFQKSRNVMFSDTESDYLFIYVFLLFPEVQK